MTKAKIKEIVAECLNNKELCRIYCSYDLNYWYYVPLLISEKLFLGIKEDDFIFDGYTIRRFRDIVKAEIKNDLCIKIVEKEGLLDNIVTPDVDVTNWETVFRSLEKRNRNIIIESESLDEEEGTFAIGRIEKIYKHHLYFRHFDADGIWQEEPFKIPYTEITSVTFAARYVDVFSKYLGSLPEDFGKI